MASITEYPITVGTPSLGNGLVGITGGPDGNVYFTDTMNNAIGQIIPSGVITELPLSGPVGGGFFKNGLDGITLGSNNKLAFTESTQGAIGNITTSGSYNQIPIDSTGNDTGQEPDQITKSSDGTLWFTEDGAMAIGELTTSGVFHAYTVPNATNGGILGPSLKGITVGSDGNIWFTNWGSSGDFIGMMTPSGSVTEFPLSFGTDPVGITSGPDGNLWFTAYGSNTIDEMSTSGSLLNQFSIIPPGGSSGPGDLADITVGSDDNLYFTEQTGYIGQMTTSGTVTNFPVSTTMPTVPGASGPQPLAITSGPDGNIWFTDPWTDSIGVLKIATGTSPTPTPTAAPTLTALSASTASAVTGQSIKFTATVSDLSPGGATPNGGTITFRDQNGAIGSANLVAGTAELTTTSLPAGADTITASYGGTANFAASTTGTIVTAAGNGIRGYTGDNGPATAAELYAAGVTAVDSAGDLFLPQGLTAAVREVVKATDDIVTVAGNGTTGYSGDGGLATDAELGGTNSVAVDSAGDLFLSDSYNNVVREVVKATGDIITIAGNGTAGYSGDGGPAIDAELANPLGVAVDSAGDVFFADPIYNVIREVVNATGDITTVAGDGRAGYSGDNGPATAAELNNPCGIALDAAGDLFIAEANNNVVREVVKATGDIITVAGNGTAGYSGDDGPATSAELNGPGSIAVDSEGDVFIGDSGNNRIREFTPAVTVNVTPGSIVQWSVASGGNGHYYELVMPADPSGNFSWTQADAAASAMSYDGSPGYLATVTSAAENEFLGSQFQSGLGDRGNVAWIGLTDVGHTNDWTWVTGEPFSYSNWAGGEPNNPGVEDWVGYWNVEAPAWSWNNFLLDDYAPGVLYGFIVEFNPSILPTLTALTASTASATFGQSVTFTATVSDLSAGGATPNGGTVTFRDQNGALASETLVNGVATFMTSSLPAGTDAITASYGGAAEFAPSTASTTVTISQATRTALRASTASGVFGQPFTFTASVSDLSPNGPTPNGGTVTFRDQNGALASEPLVNGVATFTTPSLPLGTDTIAASYGGTANFALSSTAGTIVTISTAPPTSGGAHRTKTLLTAKPRPSNFGQNVTVVATVEYVGRGGGKPIGDVTFYDGAIVLESDVALKGGKATLKISSLSVGPHRIWVQYSGGGDFEASRSIFLNEKVRAGRSKRLVSTAEIFD
jgi:streptogramin lyase